MILEDLIEKTIALESDSQRNFIIISLLFYFFNRILSFLYKSKSKNNLKNRINGLQRGVGVLQVGTVEKMLLVCFHRQEQKRGWCLLQGMICIWKYEFEGLVSLF